MCTTYSHPSLPTSSTDLGKHSTSSPSGGRHTPIPSSRPSPIPFRTQPSHLPQSCQHTESHYAVSPPQLAAVVLLSAWAILNYTRVSENTILNDAVNYVAMVGIGSPASDCKLNLERNIAAANGFSYADELIVDTGSAVTWIGANEDYP